MKNYIKVDIDNNRFLAINFEKSKNFENKDKKDNESIKKDIEYGYTSEKGNDIFAPTGTLNIPELKSKLDNDIISITYYTKNIKNSQSNINHVTRIGLGMGKSIDI